MLIFPELVRFLGVTLNKILESLLYFFVCSHVKVAPKSAAFLHQNKKGVSRISSRSDVCKQSRTAWNCD